MTSFNFDGKKARNVGLTCRYHMSNKMHDSIFQEGTELGLTCFLLFLLCFFPCFFIIIIIIIIVVVVVVVVSFCLFCCYSCFVLFCFFIARYICFPWNERDGISFITITPTASMGFEKSSICLRFQIFNEEFQCLSMLCCF